MASPTENPYYGPPHYGMKLPLNLFCSDGEKTFQFQESLPSAPVPNLQHTLRRYLDSIKPFVNDEEYKRNEEYARDFAENLGLQLHQKIVEKAKHTRNWLADIWEDVAYLQTREPHNPYVHMMGPGSYHFDFWHPEEDTQLERAAYTTWFMLKYWEVTRQEKLKVDRGGKKTVWCMRQYRRTFCSYKMPGMEKDELLEYFKTDSEGQCPSHLIVSCRGRFFSFDVLDNEGKVMTIPELESQFQYVRELCDSQKPGPGVGALTGDTRPGWCKMREHLIALHPDNRRNLECIQTSLGIIALEDTVINNMDELGMSCYRGVPENAWYDKPVIMSVSRNGMIVCNCDHAPFEGTILVSLTFWNHLGLTMSECKWKGPTTVRKFSEPCEMIFHIDDSVRNTIATCVRGIHERGSKVDLHMTMYKKYGRIFIRKLKMHPDTYFQMVLQYAYYKKHGRPAPTYETATIRKFYRGRTETVRSCTMESLAFSKAMVDPNVSKEEKAKKFVIAMQKHLKLMGESMELAGCDRHLMTLQLFSVQEGIPLHPLFTDPAYTKSGGNANFILSTSFLGFTPVGGSVAPMVHDGYGVFYHYTDDITFFDITTWRDEPSTDSRVFADVISDCMDEIQQLLLDVAPSNL